MANGDQSAWIDIGYNHAYCFREFEGDLHALIVYSHLRPDGSYCEGHVTPSGSAWAKDMTTLETWDVQSFEPLSMTPSLLCRACKDHGFITRGKWVPA